MGGRREKQRADPRVNARRRPTPTRVRPPRGRPPIRVTGTPTGGHSGALQSPRRRCDRYRHA
eukprot:2857381-Alexandrium_andersonii.AAC.1